MSREPYFPNKRLSEAVRNDDTFTAESIYQNCKHSWRASIGLRDYCKTAIGRRCLPMLKLLLTQMESKDYPSSTYNELMTVAVRRDFREGVELLQSKGRLLDKDCIYKCLEENNPRVLRYILEHKILLLSEPTVYSTPISNKQLKYVETCALHYCIRGRSYYREPDNVLDCVKLLVEAGADINMSDNNGRTALMEAARVCNRSGLQCLLEAGADINLSDNNGRTAFMEAARACNRSGLQCLLDAGADVNKTDTDENSAIHNVMFGSRHMYDGKWRNCLKLLLINKCHESLDAPGENGQTLFKLLLDKHESNLLWYLVTENCSLEGLDLNRVKDKLWFTDTLMFYKILFESGAPKREIEALIGTSSQMHEFHHFWKSRSLQSRCRREIRKCIGSGIRDKITQPEIDIPQCLQDYVIMKDLIPEEYFTLVMKDTDDH